MSEYQYYEFLAVDRPLTKGQMAELRQLSTRAEITPTRLQNVYHWGDFKGDPLVLMERYFDAHVYVANWGTHQLMLGFPRSVLDPATALRYEIEPGPEVHVKPARVILEFLDEDEKGGDWEDGGEGWMPALVPLRADLANGDLRALYLGWLHAAGTGELDDEAVEPPVPPGLSSLSGPLQALVEFLRLDNDLVGVAAEVSAPLPEIRPSSGELERWISGLPESEKDALLVRLASGEPHLQAELLRRYRETTAPVVATDSARATGRRTVGALLAAAKARARARRRAQAEREARERARRQEEQARARAAYLDALIGRETELWHQVAALIETKRPQDYDRAVQLLVDLRDLAARSRQAPAFQASLDELRARHAKKPSLLARLDRAGLPASAPTGPIRQSV